MMYFWFFPFPSISSSKPGPTHPSYGGADEGKSKLSQISLLKTVYLSCHLFLHHCLPHFFFPSTFPH